MRKVPFSFHENKAFERLVKWAVEVGFCHILVIETITYNNWWHSSGSKWWGQKKKSAPKIPFPFFLLWLIANIVIIIRQTVWSRDPPPITAWHQRWGVVYFCLTPERSFFSSWKEPFPGPCLWGILPAPTYAPQPQPALLTWPRISR